MKRAKQHHYRVMDEPTEQHVKYLLLRSRIYPRLLVQLEKFKVEWSYMELRTLGDMARKLSEFADYMIMLESTSFPVNLPVAMTPLIVSPTTDPWRQG